MITETALEMLNRVRQMAFHNDGTWDLSENDTHALQHVVGLVNLLSADLAERIGKDAADTLHDVQQRVYQTQLDCDQQRPAGGGFSD